MINLSDTIEIKSIGSQIIFSCKGDFAEQEQLWEKHQMDFIILKVHLKKILFKDIII